MTDEQTKQVVDTLLPPNTEPLPCPRCKRTPTLVQNESLSWYECRGWFRLHRSGSVVMEGRGDGKWAHWAAARAWNRGLVSPNTGAQ